MSVLAPQDTVGKFSVVILYDHRKHIGKAIAAYSHLARALEDEFQPDLRVWRMDIATSERYSAEANHDIAMAEVIIVTVQGDQVFPPALRHWEEGAGHSESTRPRAVIALVASDQGAEPAGDTWSSVLRDTATQICPDVFVYEPRLGPDHGPGPGLPDESACAPAGRHDDCLAADSARRPGPRIPVL